MYSDFASSVWEYYQKNGREMPWRSNTDPYWVLVSELMLQQTQVSRVIPKFEAFIDAFPTTSDLAQAALGDVLHMWSGLGYNRRAKYLHQSAKLIVKDMDNRIPNSYQKLITLPGVGPNTAGAIQAYAFNEPVVFIETNIRAVYIYHFFPDKTEIADSLLLPVIEQTLEKERPREWYWALMDYGSELKRTCGNSARRSKHYTKQSRFDGSNRQVRGAILRELTKRGSCEIAKLETAIQDNRVSVMLSKLADDGLLIIDGTEVRLP